MEKEPKQLVPAESILGELVDPEPISLGEFIDENKITLTSKHVGLDKMYKNDSQLMDKWNVVLESKGSTYSLPYFKGLGHEGKEPSVREVMECLKTDLGAAKEFSSVKEFAKEFGYDAGEMSFDRPYSRRDLNFLKDNFPQDVERYQTTIDTFKAIKAIEAPMTKFLGAAGVERLLNDVDLNIEDEPKAPAPLKLMAPTQSSPGFNM
jgi:hypothetical protein